MTDADLRQVLRAGPAGPCEREGEMVRAAAGDLPASQLPPLLEHVRGCAACAATWAEVREALAVDVSSSGSDDATMGGVSATPSPANTPWRWGVLGAIAVAATVALVVMAWPGGSEVAPDWRAAGGDGVVLVVPDGATAADRRLAWEPVPGAYEYTVHLTADDLTPAHEAVVAEPELTLPSELSGRRLLWQVTATLGDGTVRRSATQTVLVP